MNDFTVYGLRLKGDKEVRYVGQTGQPEQRLFGHFSQAQMNYQTPLCQWLREHQPSVEMFKIGYAETRAEALAIEKAIIALCRRLDHRLFNRSPGRRPKQPAPVPETQPAQDQAA